MRKGAFFVQCMLGAAVSFNMAAVCVLIPSIAGEFHVPQFSAGKIIWLFMVPYGASALVYGPLARRFDMKKMLFLSIVLFACSNALAGFAWNIGVLYIARILTAVVSSAVAPFTLIIIANKLKSENRGKYTGVFFSSTFLSSFIGLILSGFVYWRWIFFIPALSAFILIPLLQRIPALIKKESEGFTVNYAAALKDKTVVSIFAYVFSISVFYYGIQQWLGVYFSSFYGFNQFLISILVSFTVVSGIFGELTGGWFSDIAGRKKTIELGLALMVLSVFSLSFKLTVPVLFMIMIAWGMGRTFNHVGLTALLTDLPSEFVNEAASLNSGVRFLAGGIGAIIGGLFMERSFNFGFLIFGWGLVSLALVTRKFIFKH